ncbi:MAG: hypothetical protein CMQ61_13940 [Gammaproteobacteria bacterium]|nr:hypothetical protein [Gammaproteobacteria bacterium]
MTTSSNQSWQPVIASSLVMSLALLGDALLYAVLPLHAAAFGISLAWVGILLSANRIVRVFAYGAIARLGHQFGQRRACIAAAVGAIVSTGMYGLVSGEVWLLAARVLWGLSYATLLLATLAYAVTDRGTVGARVGWSRAIQRAGPIAALIGGAWLTASVGPRDIFVWLAVLTILAVPFAWSLPRKTVVDEGPRSTRSLARPSRVDLIFVLQGAGVDGVFAISITLLLAESMSLEAALALGGTMLALRHIGEAVASPIFGTIADRFGARPVFALSLGMTTLGFVGVAMDYTIAGAIVLLIFRGALAVLGPAVIVQSADESAPVMGDLANMQAWRDLGAAIGPVVTGFALAVVSPQWLHGCTALLLLLSMFAWMSVRR